MDKFKNIFSSSFVSSYKRTFGILFLLILAVAIPVTLGLIKQQQDIRQRASGPQCAAPQTNISCPNPEGGPGSTFVDYTCNTGCPLCKHNLTGEIFSVAE